MGSSLVIRTHKDCPTAELQKWVSAVQADDAYSDGHEYSDQWNMCDGLHVINHIHASVNEAEEYISEHQEKWGPLFAVKARSVKENSAEREKLLKPLYEKRHGIAADKQAYLNALLNAAHTAKSATRSCKHCGSKIAKAYISFNCPACRHPMLMTPTYQKRVDAFDVKLVAADKTIQTASEKLARANATGEVVWVVGGWCAS